MTETYYLQNITIKLPSGRKRTIPLMEIRIFDDNIPQEEKDEMQTTFNLQEHDTDTDQSDDNDEVFSDSELNELFDEITEGIKEIKKSPDRNNKRTYEEVEESNEEPINKRRKTIEKIIKNADRKTTCLTFEDQLLQDQLSQDQLSQDQLSQENNVDCKTTCLTFEDQSIIIAYDKITQKEANLIYAYYEGGRLFKQIIDRNKESSEQNIRKQIYDIIMENSKYETSRMAVKKRMNRAEEIYDILEELGGQKVLKTLSNVTLIELTKLRDEDKKYIKEYLDNFEQ